MQLTRLIDFRDANSKWQEIGHFAGDYYNEDIAAPFHFLHLKESQLIRRVIDVFSYQKQIDQSFFYGQEMIFYKKFVVIQFWGVENFIADNQLPCYCSIGFQNQRWLLTEDESFLYEHRQWNVSGSVPPTAIGVDIRDNVRQRITKRIVITPSGGQIL